ncbi:alpha/beta fold hydrolase [Nocardia sp. NPDC060249]|uniref:alpha/beta fold hydrolase n=1 Tax=Nocardia sp. NPDC060249 TaxID=3347082 RepID=UPI003662F671
MNSHIETTDGHRLFVTTTGDPTAPTVVLVHGFPDDHTVWNGVAHALSDQFHVVTFDVRGSGESDKPRAISAYRKDQLAADIGAVIEAVSPDRPVHLVGHDWGSVQAWEAAAAQGTRTAIASLTSISGPYLDGVPRWLRNSLAAGPTGWRAAATMWKSPFYMGTLATPLLGALLCRIGLVDAMIGLAHRLETGVAPDLSPHQARDNRAGLKIYTANLVPSLLRPRLRRISVPVQVLAPRRDIFITPASQRDVAHVAEQWQVHDVDGGHWVPAFNPTEIADRVRVFVDAVEAAATTTPAGEPREHTA